MDAAAWTTRSVVDGRRSDRQADAVAHRQAREARQARDARRAREGRPAWAGDGHRVRWRWPRRIDIPPDAVGETVGPLETEEDGRELAGAGKR
jgi:hypothetical protein